MIAISNVSKTYGKRALFEEVSLSITRGEKIGLIGPNGAGKSTLFNLILGEIEISSGRIQINKGTRIGYLPQESKFPSNHTVLQEVVEGDPTIVKLKKEKNKLEANNQTASHRYGDILHELEMLGYFKLEYKAKKILSGLGFSQADFNRPVKEMSGGWQMRTLLARLLTGNYDCLLLDEPTNYLDLNAALWFKDYLSSYNGTFIMVSHDQVFLNEVTNYTLVLEFGKINKVKGNYQHYRDIQDQRRSHALKQFDRQEKKRKQLEGFIQRFHAQPNKASQVRAKRKVLEKMQEIVIPPDRRDSIRTFKFPPTQRSGYRVVDLKKVSKSYGDIEVYKDIDFEVINGERAVFSGVNGAGKSTLLKILAGVIDADSGTRALGHNISTGYFSQTRMDVLNEDRNVLDEALSASPADVKTETVRTILGMFLFSGDDVDKKVKILSGGEKSRLIMAKLLIEAPNFLLLDEPTTHLDVDAVDALVKALTQYQGTLVFISHDIYFVRSVANTVFEVEDGQIKKFPGDFDYYLRKKSQTKDTSKKGKAKSRYVTSKEKEALATNGVKLQEDTKNEQNALISKKIKGLRKKQEKLKTDRNVKARVVDNPRHGSEVVNEYKMMVKKLNEDILAIEVKINKLKAKFLK
ncbi:MAG: ABC-F family ATP-binding cassette domain-containing protein [Candidatus Omnitrophica bacterium]|nr:ABC-F family ATP-binding cassette domain-containing protein [Candidatus Omnitrophota bacterium]